MTNPTGPTDPKTSSVGVAAGNPDLGHAQSTVNQPAGSAKADQAGRTIKDDAAELADRARDGAADLAGQARRVADDVKHEAEGAIEHAKQSARASATKQKDAAADQMGGFAHALKTASDDLHERGQEFSAEYVKQAAGGLERISDLMHKRDLDQLVESVEDFARRQPVAFAGGAVVLGFGLARLMKASAERRRNKTPYAGADHGGIA